MTLSGCPRKFYHRFITGRSLMNLNLSLKLDLRLFSDVWSENAALFKRHEISFKLIHQYYT